jgi:hypothetical protein
VSLRRTLAGLAVALLATATLAGCAGDDEPHASATTATTSAVPEEPPIPTNTTLQQPRAAETIKPQATLTAVPGASQLPAPTGAPRTIQGFPVPPGVKVKDPGALDETWQFDIHTDDPAGVIAFYKRVLPKMGFTVRTDVTYTIGTEKVQWDLAFDGRVSGTIVRDPDYSVVFVVVNPPGQKAIAGE